MYFLLCHHRFSDILYMSSRTTSQGQCDNKYKAFLNTQTVDLFDMHRALNCSDDRRYDRPCTNVRFGEKRAVLHHYRFKKICIFISIVN